MADVTIGIDPGKTGAVAIRWPDDKWSIYDCPTVKIKSGKSTKEFCDPQGMAELLDLPPLIEGGIHAYIEKVGPMPGQGVTSMFRFGEGFGMWQGILAALKIPHTMVTPQRWKKETMQGMGKDKDASRIRARQLFPELCPQLNLKKHHGRADAILIAEYGRRHGRVLR